jgi:hypothetical protein
VIFHCERSTDRYHMLMGVTNSCQARSRTVRLKETILSVVSALLLMLAGLTVLPWPDSQPDLLGYRTICAFVPLSTLILLGLAAIAWVMRAALCGRGPWKDGTGAAGTHFPPDD